MSKSFGITMAAILMVIAGALIWLNVGREECPHEIMHMLKPYAESHNLHYRVTKEQNPGDAPFWCVTLWKKGEHWYSEDNYYTAGYSRPKWQSCTEELRVAIKTVVADVEQTPQGHLTTLSNTLQKCED